MLETSIFSFSQNVFYLSQNKFQILSHIILSFARALNLNKSRIFQFGNELTGYEIYQI